MAKGRGSFDGLNRGYQRGRLAKRESAQQPSARCEPFVPVIFTQHECLGTADAPSTDVLWPSQCRGCFRQKHAECFLVYRFDEVM